MQYMCPHCELKTISGWAKFTARDLSPAICKNCGGSSIKGEVCYAPWAKAAIDLLAASSFIWLPIALIAYIVFVGLWWPIFLLVALFIFLIVWQHHTAPLIEPNPIQATKEHKMQLVFLALILIAILVYNYFEYGA